MDGSSFDLIVQELQTQQHIMEEMKAENRKLRQQLTALHTGQGVFLEINGTRMALDIQLAPTSSTTAQQSTGSFSPSQSLATNDDKKLGEDQLPTVEQNNHQEESKTKRAEIIHKIAIVSQPEQEVSKRPSTFLEEIMLDEFASALTAPTAAQMVQEHKPEVSKEEQQEALRRELIGSFLLE